MKKILVASDGSENGRHALDKALELAQASGAALTIAYVRASRRPDCRSVDRERLARDRALRRPARAGRR
jgi:nucleotide-binding universal stress UspA family protein